LKIIQKNSSRSRGEEWGHAFFFALKLADGTESPIIGQDEWADNPTHRPEMLEYNMREIRSILVMKKGQMVRAIFFYLKSQENYKNVLASAECFAQINYEAMIKDPASKGCIARNYTLKENERFVGVRYA
jgi:hypothetical protein